MQSIIRFIKGMCMGFADVVPGVSGGTVALVLGIYVRFIEGIKSLNIGWLLSLMRWLFSGFDSRHLDDAKHHFFRIHWAFLIPLGAGIIVAFGIGSQVIPPLMDEHPALMRAFFMGLVLASIYVPLREIREYRPAVIIMVLVATVATFFLVGAGGEAPVRWSQYEVTSETTFKDFVRQHPSTREPLALYCSDPGAPNNDVLKRAVATIEGNDAAVLSEVCQRLRRAGDDADLHAALVHEYHLDDNDVSPFDQMVLPAQTVVSIPQPAFWYVFLCGILAICAMVLPGISGSFILLMLGAYFFVLSSIKGSIEFLTGSGGDIEALYYVSLFSIGALIGITSFVRLLSWTFARAHDVTLAALVGLMIGSLRVLWPFKLGSMHGGLVRNVMPGDGDPVVLAVVLVLAGFVLVTALSLVSARIDEHLGNEKESL